jgi:uncharacterized protein (DUF111 family)
LRVGARNDKIVELKYYGEAIVTVGKEKILYFEAYDGISGDMVLGALVDLGADVDAIRAELDKFVPDEYALVANPFERSGIHGINLDVIVDEHKAEGHTHGHEHRHHSDITALITGSGISDVAKKYAIAIFDVIAEAEAAVHRTEKADVAFHEVGAMDSIIDIVGTAIAIDLLGAERFFCSAPHDGTGRIVCRHGIIPVPVPAVMEMAKRSGIPIVIEDTVLTEMITPTGFGILKGLGAKFEPRLGILTERVGYGFGKRDTGRFGAVRVTLGALFEEEEETR